MISVEEAKGLIYSNLKRSAPVKVPLRDAAGTALAEDVICPVDVPLFDQSAMDGYAIRFDERNKALYVPGEMRAGETDLKQLNEGQAIRIFTGAPVPKGADTVVMQEKVTFADGYITIQDDQLQKAKNVRPAASEIAAGQLALKSGDIITAGAAGFLAGMGICEVKIYPQPKVGIIVTGSELIEPGSNPTYGKVFESNSYALDAALKRIGITDVHISLVADDASVLKKQLETALMNFDMLLLTGGVSVGKYDHVADTTRALNVHPLFHKVKQKPGKPLYLGTWNGKPVFGLPGNPSSVLTCFYEYVIPAVETMTGKKDLVQKMKATLLNEYAKPPALAHFLKGDYQNGRVQVLDAQESYKMSSFAHANCLIYIQEHVTTLKKGDDVEIHLLPL